MALSAGAFLEMVMLLLKTGIAALFHQFKLDIGLVGLPGKLLLGLGVDLAD
jgi:hypothetical protein